MRFFGLRFFRESSPLMALIPTLKQLSCFWRIQWFIGEFRFTFCVKIAESNYFSRMETRKVINLLWPLKNHLLGILYCAKEMRLLKALPNEEFLSQDNDFLFHTAWKTPLPSPTNPRGIAEISKGWYAQGHRHQFCVRIFFCIYFPHLETRKVITFHV